MALDELAVGQSVTLGGEGVNGLAIGPIHLRSKVTVRAWHRGYKTGEGNSAFLKVFHNGAEIAGDDDGPFDNYNLAVTASLDLDALATASLSIQYGNHMATTNSFGLEAVVKGLAT